jgi:CRP-like cAMP-binding protein
MFFIASGQVEFKSDVLSRTYQTGDYFGLAAMLENDVSYGAFRTSARCRLLKLYREDFRRLEHVVPDVARQLRAEALQRVKARENAIVASRQKPPPEEAPGPA